MAQITLLTGGVRSGKSSYALELAHACAGPKCFIATAQAFDSEMSTRIENHKTSRGKNYITIEEPVDLASALAKCRELNAQTIVIDCLTVWIGNLMHSYNCDTMKMNAAKQDFIQALQQITARCFIVTNEVGWGIVPENKMARDFRDFSGSLNQEIAKLAESVYLLCSGIPLKIK
jgi:adenosylcobinamide kinase / adenosylcobinamide-phosphate guanylyltransferase